ncbi:MAG: hypothetical protein WBG46_03570 [Nonlabens sp.]
MSLITSCSIDDGEPPVNYGYVGVTSVEIPDSFEFGETYDIDVTYSVVNECLVFSGFEMIRGQGNTRTVRTVVADYGSNDCDDITDTPDSATETLQFQVIFMEDYTFRFSSGIDEDGNETFLEYIIPVE